MSPSDDWTPEGEARILLPMSWFEKVRGEVSLVAAVTLYFLVSFVTIGVIKMLFLAEFNIEVGGIAKAAIGALVVGKVVIVLDKTSFGNRFKQHALWLDIVYKALVYTFFCAMVLSIEKIIHELSEAPSFTAAAQAALQNAEIHRFAGTTFCLFLVFVGYALMTALSDHFGKALLLSFLVNAKTRRESRESLSLSRGQ